MMSPPVHAESTVTHSPEETRAFGRELARRFVRGSVVLLSGDLGAGKTTLAQGICHGLGVDAWACSPTFTLVNEYDGTLGDEPLRVYHCDFYRIEEPEELETLALDEVLYGGIALIEWPEVAAEWAPDDAVRVNMARTGPEERRIEVSGEER